jgi:hypothetical protein
MAHDDGRDAAARRTIHTMDIAAADRSGFDLYQNLVWRCNGRDGYINITKMPDSI